jgi:membrane protease subunit HflC
MKKTLCAGLVLILAFVVLRLSVYTVDAAEFGYATVLGEHVATYDGADATGGAGLHLGWPWPVQAVQRLDRRLQQFDLPATELLTHDPEGKTIDKMLLVEAYVCWRIADRDAVDLFVRRIGSVERANAILEPRIRSELGAAIGQMRMDDLVSTESVAGGRTRVDVTIEGLHDRLLRALRKPVREEYGIDLVDIRLRRFSHPAQVRDSIFERIRSERNKKVTEYDSEGKRLASDIITKAEENARTMLARAHAEEVQRKGDAEAEAMRIRNEAHRQDPEFYAFLKKMEKLQSILGDNKTVLLLSTNRPLFESLFQPPRPEADKPAADRKAAPPDEKKPKGGPG